MNTYPAMYHGAVLSWHDSPEEAEAAVWAVWLWERAATDDFDTWLKQPLDDPNPFTEPSCKFARRLEAPHGRAI